MREQKIKRYVILFFMFLFFTIAVGYGIRGMMVILMTERFWPGFWYVLVACPTTAIGTFMLDYLDAM